jgi:two-component SAPR family response regulator
MEVVGMLNDSRKVLAYLDINEVDILVTDLSIPNLAGVDLTLQVRGQFSTFKIVMLTVSEDAETIRDAVEAFTGQWIPIKFPEYSDKSSDQVVFQQGRRGSNVRTMQTTVTVQL